MTQAKKNESGTSNLTHRNIYIKEYSENNHNYAKPNMYLQSNYRPFHLLVISQRVSQENQQPFNFNGNDARNTSGSHILYISGKECWIYRMQCKMWIFFSLVSPSFQLYMVFT